MCFCFLSYLARLIRTLFSALGENLFGVRESRTEADKKKKKTKNELSGLLEDERGEKSKEGRKRYEQNLALFKDQQPDKLALSKLDPKVANMQARQDDVDVDQEAVDKFRIRTSDRRHLDFDPEFELTDQSVVSQKSRWEGDFHFVQAADSQLGMIDSYVHGRTEPGWQEEIELCRQLIEKCSQMDPKPKFVIVCGDLVDAVPPSEIRNRQVRDFKRIFADLDKLDIPLVCVCGNHDVGDEPTENSILEYRQTFGDDYFYFTSNNVLFIVINSQFYQHRHFVQDYAQQQDQWLEALLAKCKLFKYSIVFQHIPWFLDDFNEADDYFNINKEVRLKWLRKFREAGVTKVMCGHYHRNAGGWYEGMELVVTSAIGAQCGSDKSGARIVRVLEDSIEHQYYSMQDLPQKIHLPSPPAAAPTTTD